MTAVRALLVDFDGTLADTGAANHAAYAAALEEAGVTIARDRFDALAFGRNWRQFLPAMLADGGSSADPAEVAARKTELYPRFFDHIRINDALVELIRRHRDVGPVALVTTASRRNVEAILAHFDLATLFDLVLTGDDVERHKPDPQAYELAAERLGVAPADCVIVEDSEIGLAAARAFGAVTLQVSL